jgi:predicted nucleic-acid-binding Zn-ribbon protein
MIAGGAAIWPPRGRPLALSPTQLSAEGKPMRKLILDILVVNMMLGVAVLALATPSNAQYVITEIIDSTGDGAGNSLVGAWGVAADSSGNVYVVGQASNNAFKIANPGTCSTSGTPCMITEIIDATGDGDGNGLDLPYGVAVDSSGNVYVTGAFSSNAFKIATPGSCSTSGTPCTITEIIDATGDGSGNTLAGSYGVAVDSSDNVFVTGSNSSNAFKIATPGACSTSGTPCTITEIIDATGDGGGNGLDFPYGVAADSSGNVYVTGKGGENAFRIATPGTCSTSGTPCTITEIIDATGDGSGNTLDDAMEVAVDSSGNVYVTGEVSDNAFRIATPGTCSTSGTPCTITEIINGTAGLNSPEGVAAGSSGNVYVTGSASSNAFKIAAPGTCSTSGTPCTITEIIDATGDGGGNGLTDPYAVAVDSSGNAYVTGYWSDNAFKIQPVSRVPVLSNRGLAVLGAGLLCIVFWVARRQRMAHA